MSDDRPAVSLDAQEPAHALVRRGADGRFLPGSSRPPARRRGAQAGNLNAVKSPWSTYWRRRALRPEDRWVLALVRDFVPALVDDKGGPDAVSAAEMRVMELAGAARACWLLALARGDHEATARFLAREESALARLGLERRARPVPTLAEVIAQRAASATPTPETGAGS